MSTTQKPEVVVITGAAAGVGRAAAIEFARAGPHIGLTARAVPGMDGLKGAKRDVEAGGKALMLPCDVADSDGARLGGSLLPAHRAGGARRPALPGSPLDSPPWTT